jgi:hypothetical protein
MVDEQPFAAAEAAAAIGSGAAQPTDRAASAEGRSGLTPEQALEFELVRNARYHEDRERFFDTVHRWTMFFVVLLGTAAFGDLFGQNRILAALAAMAGLVDLVFDVSGKARAHAQLRRHSFELLASLQDGGNVGQVQSRLTATYGEEPNPNGTVGCLAYNAANEALGRDRLDQFSIGRWRRLFRHFMPRSDDLKTFRELAEDAPGGDLSPR